MVRGISISPFALPALALVFPHPLSKPLKVLRAGWEDAGCPQDHSPRKGDGSTLEPLLGKQRPWQS